MISRVLGVTLAILHLCSCGLTLGVGEEAKQRPPLDGSPVAMDTNLTTLATTASTTPAAAQGDSSLQGVSHPKPDDVQVGCKELRSKRYITDGFCTSVKPITEVVCTGHCLPIRNLPWYAEFIKVWARTKILEWRCVDDVVRRKRVRLLCENGETRSYKVKVVRSCKCKRYMRQQNESPARHRTEGKSRKKLGANRNNDSRP